MLHRPKSCLFASIAVLLSVPPATAADNFRRLKAAEIKAKIAGMEITDEVHFVEQYMRDGTLKSFQMGRPTTSNWWVENDHLCTGRDKSDAACNEIWISGNKLQIRPPGTTYSRDAILQKPKPRE